MAAAPPMVPSAARLVSRYGERPSRRDGSPHFHAGLDISTGHAGDPVFAAKEGTVEAWARDPGNPVGGWYGLKKGLRGRFGNYVPPVLEAMGLAEVEHNARNNRMRAI